LKNVSSELDKVGDIMRNANDEINSRVAQGKRFQYRLIITCQAAAKLHNPTEDLLILSKKYTSQLHPFGDGIRAPIEEACSAAARN
jgi:hypothetical protein